MIGDAARVTEIDMNTVECFDPSNNQCQISSACVLGSAFNDALRDFPLAVLNGLALANLLRPEKTLMLLLGLEPVKLRYAPSVKFFE